MEECGRQRGYAAQSMSGEQHEEKVTKEEDERIKRMRKRDDLLARSRYKKTEKGKHNA